MSTHNPLNGNLTIIESPFAGDTTTNLAYARNCVRHSILSGEVPFASHLFYTQHGILNDTIPADRELGITLGLEFYAYARQCVVYQDLGISPGMARGIQHAQFLAIPVIYRSLYITPTPTPTPADGKKSSPDS